MLNLIVISNDTDELFHFVTSIEDDDEAIRFLLSKVDYLDKYNLDVGELYYDETLQVYKIPSLDEVIVFDLTYMDYYIQHVTI